MMGDDLLNDESPEVTKDDFKTFNRIFDDDRQGLMSPTEIHNAYVKIIKNRTKWKNDPFSDEDIRSMSTNPSGKLGTLKELEERRRRRNLEFQQLRRTQ